MRSEHHFSEKHDHERTKCLEDDDEDVAVIPFDAKLQLLEISRRCKGYEHDYRKVYSPAHVDCLRAVPYTGDDPDKDEREDRTYRSFFRLGEDLVHHF